MYSLGTGEDISDDSSFESDVELDENGEMSAEVEPSSIARKERRPKAILFPLNEHGPLVPIDTLHPSWSTRIQRRELEKSLSFCGKRKVFNGGSVMNIKQTVKKQRDSFVHPSIEQKRREREKIAKTNWTGKKIVFKSMNHKIVIEKISSERNNIQSISKLSGTEEKEELEHSNNNNNNNHHPLPNEQKIKIKSKNAINFLRNFPTFAKCLQNDSEDHASS